MKASSPLMAARSTSDPVRSGALLARLTVRRRLMLALLLAAFVGVIGLAQASGIFGPADRLAMKIIAHLRWVPGAEWMTSISRLLDRLGEGGGRLAITLVVALFLARASRPAALLWLIVTSGAIMLINPLVKAVFLAPRPDEIAQLAVASGHSFPSGHAAGAMVLCGALALLTRSLALQLICAGLILATGLSRVWLGVHWPSDVIGGWAEGAAWLLVMSLWLPADERGRRPADRPADLPAE